MANRTDQSAYYIRFAVQWVWPIPFDHPHPICSRVRVVSRSCWQARQAEKSVARIQEKGSRVEPRDAVPMMVRTNEHEKAVSAGATYRGCFKGSDLRRTEIVCVAWASQTLAG
jgi:SP family general alpha glucoside:H+ symporter-like MFS transporter